MDRKTTASRSCSQYSNKIPPLHTILSHVWKKIDSFNLLNLITSLNHPGMNSQMLNKLDTSDEEIPRCVDDPYDLPKNADEWIDSISST